jgi:TorA maturation chaperone TorD
VIAVAAIDQEDAMTAMDSGTVLLAARAATYRIVQNLFGNEPDIEFLTKLAGSKTREVLAIFSQGEGEYGCALEKLYAVLYEGLEDSEAFETKLENNFTRLFIGPGNVEAAPWESLYMGNESTLFQLSTLEVRKVYVAQGFIPRQYPNVADDHIALELDFMAALAKRAEVSFVEGDYQRAAEYLVVSKDFLEQRLLVWVPTFVRTLHAAKSSYFYRDIGGLLKTFLPIDRQALNELIRLVDKSCAHADTCSI